MRISTYPAKTYILASVYGIAPANTAAANTTGFVSAMTALLGGGTLFCDWTGTVTVDVSAGPIIPTDGIEITGRGRATKIKAADYASASTIVFSQAASATFTIRDLTLEGPTTLTGAFVSVGVTNNQTTGTTRVINCAVQKFTFCLRRNPSATADTSLDVINSDIAGYGATYASTPILWDTAGTGCTGYMRMIGGSIKSWGHPSSDGSAHGIYVGLDCELDVDGVILDASPYANDFGYAIKILDGSTTAANVAKRACIRGCTFKNHASNALSRGIVSGNLAGHITQITDCSFLNRSIAIEIGAGTTIVSNCTFTGHTNTAAYILNPTAGGSSTFSNCRFAHTGLGVLSLQFTGVYCEFFACEFILGSTQTEVFRTNTGADATSQIVLRACRFAGSCSDKMLVVGNGTGGIVVDSCVVSTTNAAGTMIYVPTAGAGGILRLLKNEFSPAGTVYVKDTVHPAVFEVSGNYGTPGFKSEGGGVSTSSPGAVTVVNIAHGLAVTPALFQAERGNANAQGAPAYYVTADATNVILTFVAVLLAATSYSWNWTARYQAA